jgi:hypothetical protein
MKGTMPGALARFQDAFARALSGDPPPVEIAALVSQPGFAVYRNTVMKGCIDALQANYPAVMRLVGEEWFRAVAAVYVREAPPGDPRLLRYGADFAEFLARFDPAAEFPYLPCVTRLDRYWTEAHAALDEKVLEPGIVAHLAPDTLARTILRPHAAARWEWFSDTPVYTIWSRNRDGDAAPPADHEWKPEGALLVRPRDAVNWLPLDAAGCRFLDVCAAGGALIDAAEAAHRAQGDADLERLMSTLLAAGAFAATDRDDPPSP